ncbi:hypothetical protein ABFS82_11G054600 [Erythranthe guttata]|uniref:Uncharacterized protein n=1 Tax=Erythranthe guttata TaxID=4155 RepID=A0A022QSY9_ERYGU|nr:PREDICTED: uncharacterized protein LOC105965498 [Erythranthe guttata]EYU30699.1 hypothetical protein MIMGU_mgv1a016938mg [Erythranthe guttata]|eukprot:XP_012845503.1 PREDICTED: uncharacterized protein LOC105965498 [Erythranthe guttata]
MKFKPPPKRKKLDSAPSSSPSYYTHGVVPAEKREVNLTHVRKSMAVEIQPSNVDLKIQQAKCFAVAQAQQDCCTGNFKIFDSPFGNYLVPVIPTRAELGG